MRSSDLLEVGVAAELVVLRVAECGGQVVVAWAWLLFIDIELEGGHASTFSEFSPVRCTSETH